METVVPLKDKNIDEVQANDFTPVKTNLGKNTWHIDVNMFEVAAGILKEIVLKNGEDKAALKAENQQLQQYISNLLHGTLQAMLLLPQVLETPDDHRQLSQLVVYGKLTQDWIEEVVVKGKAVLTELY
jgi:hypothetical protein